MQRRCSKCKEVKDIEDFPRHRGDKYGRSYWCKPCHNKRKREQRQREKQRDPIAFREKVISRLKKWQEENPDKVREASARRSREKYQRERNAKISSPEYQLRQAEIAYRKTPEYRRKMVEEYRRANLEKVSLRVRRWQINNPDKMRRRARSNNLPTTDAIKVRLELFDNSCVYCGGENESLDHLIPVSKGGLDEPENLVPCCKSCNSKKNNRDWLDWYKTQPSYSVERAELIMASMQYVAE